jgi:hypothetical protein
MDVNRSRVGERELELSGLRWRKMQVFATRRWNFRSHKMLGIFFWLAEELLVSQEVLCCLQLGYAYLDTQTP